MPFIISRWRQQTPSPFLGFSSLIQEKKRPGVYPRSGNKLQTSSQYGLLEKYKQNDDYNFDGYKYSRMIFNSDGNREFPRSLNLTTTSHDGLVELVDLFPTLVDLAGLPALFPCPHDSRHVDTCTEGMSLSPLFNLLQGGSIPKVFLMQGNTKSKESLSNYVLSLYSLPKNRISKVIKTLQLDSELLHNIKIKRAAFSQYPRPGITPSVQPDSDQCHARDATVMGYSMRMLRYRYTVWLRFNGTTLTSDWSDIVAQELYDHKLDPQENHNVVGKARYAHVISSLHTQLRKGWQHVVSSL